MVTWSIYFIYSCATKAIKPLPAVSSCKLLSSWSSFSMTSFAERSSAKLQRIKSVSNLLLLNHTCTKFHFISDLFELCFKDHSHELPELSCWPGQHIWLGFKFKDFTQTELRTKRTPPPPSTAPLPNPKRSFTKRIFSRQTGSLSSAKPVQEPTLSLFRAPETGSLTAQNMTHRTTGSDQQGEMAHPSVCAVVPTIHCASLF